MLWGAIWLPIATVVAKLIDWQPNKLITVRQKLILIASLYPLAPLIIYLMARMENTSFADYGLNWQPSLFSSVTIGVGWGIISLIIIFILESLLGFARWEWSNIPRLFPLGLSLLVLGLAIALIEELVFRGFILNQLEKDYTYGLAAAISSLIFALLHLIWSPKETLPQIPGLWLMGMILVGARLVDYGNLGLAIGLHTGWIFSLSCVDSTELITYTDKNRPWLTGIKQQPLAGLAGILGLLITAIALTVRFRYFI
ncbi:MAG: lysostaphin resistance A-like protein [Xenococcaceae cyanobacterium]